MEESYLNSILSEEDIASECVVPIRDVGDHVRCLQTVPVKGAHINLMVKAHFISFSII